MSNSKFNFQFAYRLKYCSTNEVNIEPHVYQISAKALHNLKENKSSQCIIVSGESGAGKTETVKILLNHLNYLSSDSTIAINTVRSIDLVLTLLA